MSEGIPINVKNGKIVVESGADKEISEAVGVQNAKVVSWRARQRLWQLTKEFVCGQIGPIMGVARRDTEKFKAEDNRDHQAMGGKPEEEETGEAMADTERFDLENGIA